jgi:membrane protein DedA with SNARE-associated domain
MDAIAHHLQQFILDLGYTGLFVLIVLESTAVPIPSLLVMPFAGFMAAQGHFSLPLILAVNSAAALTGSMLSYWFGAAGGKKLLLRYGKWLLIKPEDLDKAHGYFERYGARTIFVARFLPVIRHIISIPAGIARMRLDKFLALTFAGATIWGGGLMILGYELGANWESVIKTWKKIDVFVAIAIVIAIVLVTVRFVRSRRARAATAAHTPAPGREGSDPGTGS